MGGLVNGSTVKGDLWIVEAGGGNLACYPIPTHFEGPGPRVGHASLLAGNAFIVFGGDTKIHDRDVLDDTLYLLNTCMFEHFLGPSKAQSNLSQLHVTGQELYPRGNGLLGDTVTLSISLARRYTYLEGKSKVNSSTILSLLI